MERWQLQISKDYEYKIINNYVEVYLYKRDGRRFTCLIDLEDLDTFINYQYRWFPNVNHAGYYVCTTIHLGKVDGKIKSKTVYFHRLIMGFPENKHIDHINNNTLDNRKTNLRVTENNQNLKNRNGKNSNNISGYRNVSWNSRLEKWAVQLQVNGKNKVFGYFDDPHEAGKLAAELREKYYGEYKGIS